MIAEGVRIVNLQDLAAAALAQDRREQSERHQRKLREEAEAARKAVYDLLGADAESDYTNGMARVDGLIFDVATNPGGLLAVNPGRICPGCGAISVFRVSKPVRNLVDLGRFLESTGPYCVDCADGGTAEPSESEGRHDVD